MISCRSSLYDFNFLFLQKKLKKKAKNTTTYETIRHICWNSGSVCNNEHTFEKDLHANNQFHPFFPRCWRDTGTLLLWVLWACLATTIKNNASTFTSCKKIKYYHQISYLIFCYFVHAWPHPPKITGSTCRKLWCLSARK